MEIILGIPNTLVKRILTFQFGARPTFVQPPRPVIGNWGKTEENSIFRAENRAAQAQPNTIKVYIIFEDDIDLLDDDGVRC